MSELPFFDDVNQNTCPKTGFNTTHLPYLMVLFSLVVDMTVSLLSGSAGLSTVARWSRWQYRPENSIQRILPPNFQTTQLTNKNPKEQARTTLLEGYKPTDLISNSVSIRLNLQECLSHCGIFSSTTDPVQLG